MSLRTIVGEVDEGLRRDIIKVLERVEGVEVIYSTDNGKDLLNVLKLMKPQIAIISTHMPDLSGIKVGELIREDQPHLELIFLSTTVEDLKNAVRLYAADIIEKPVNAERLYTTISRLKHKYDVIEKIVQLKASGGYQIVRNKDIYLIEAIDKKTKVYTAKESFICDHSLKEMEKLLSYDNFFRASRSNIINLEKIKSVKPYTRTSYEVIFDHKSYRGYLSKKMHESYKDKMRNYCVVL
ncbi:LytR/AlgR family response regulator transcription factor [Alkaliphilus transvaalensis]|uniref:LytR/AlgR family response regulator transcription factor n=1 Tax=Alkaliphilus transvaalensis TaxID=114628 RepID=UPI000687BD59|nr:LytTR family DNA-binding domain-containing protein [Alkaliphilus transvaalensis]